MATYPYISGQGGVIQAMTQLRKGFPSKVDAGYLKRFNIAPANESYVISILKFLGLIDDEGNRVEEKTDYFYGNDEAFRAGLEATLRSSYAQMFDEMGDGALDAERTDLTHWFRAADKSSDLVGQRQASTFQTLAALAGHGQLPAARASGAKTNGATTTSTAKKTAATKAGKKAAAKPVVSGEVPQPAIDVEETPVGGSGFGLTVRIEVNLPPGGDADTYDAIFASIKKHLMS